MTTHRPPAPPPRLRPNPRRLAQAAAVLALVACRADSNKVNVTTPTDARPVFDATQGDTSSSVFSVDFTVEGCPAWDATANVCRGIAPLELTFVPITSAPPQRYLWTFDEAGNNRATERTPRYRYTLPGVYSVTLLAVGASSSAARTKAGFIVVLANELGGPCDVDPQCAPGLSCTCGSANKCPEAFPRGLCTKPCEGGCPTGSSCVDFSGSVPAMSTTMPPAMPDPWRRPLCLKDCTEDTGCTPGLRCRLLPPSTPSASEWPRTCFPDYPGDLGSSCRSGNDRLTHEKCLSGLCADYGALGLCSADCSTKPCPPNSACANFGDRKLCVRPCTPSFACREDPLLACNPPGGTGPGSFAVAASPADALYCTPKRCEADPECSPAGRCLDGSPRGQCVRQAP